MQLTQCSEVFNNAKTLSQSFKQFTTMLHTKFQCFKQIKSFMLYFKGILFRHWKIAELRILRVCFFLPGNRKIHNKEGGEAWKAFPIIEIRIQWQLCVTKICQATTWHYEDQSLFEGLRNISLVYEGHCLCKPWHLQIYHLILQDLDL